MIYVLIGIGVVVLAMIAVALIIAGRELDSIVLRPPQKLPTPFR